MFAIMLFRTPHMSRADARRLAELDDARAALGEQVGQASPWIGRLRRAFQASSVESSTAIEGFSIPADEALAIVEGRAPAAIDDSHLAVECYARAMSHVAVMADDPSFRWSDRVVLDLHFDACSFQPDQCPGRWRTGAVGVTAPGGRGELAYSGPDAGEVPALMAEAVEWLEHGDRDAHVVVRAAMAHLHVVSIHPFADGNGRVARIVQSLVLARYGVLAPDLGSIEEYLGAHTSAYYAALREVQGGSYQPERDAAPWLTFCLDAHLDQVRRRAAQIEHAAARWSALEAIVEEHGWPDRLAIALEQSLFGGTDRSRYAAEADIALPTATIDLRRLADAGLLAATGKGRTTRYRAGRELRRRLD